VRAQRRGGEPPGAAQVLHQRAVLAQRRGGKRLQRAEVYRQVLLCGVLERAVFAREEDRSAHEVERAHDVLERRAQQAALVPLHAEVVDERDERRQQPVTACGRGQPRLAHRAARRLRRAALERWGHGGGVSF
jgi:hypothetical protein